MFLLFVDVTAVCILEVFQNQQSMLLADKVLKQLGKEKAKEKYKVGMWWKGTNLRLKCKLYYIFIESTIFVFIFCSVVFAFLRTGSLLCHLLSLSSPTSAPLLMTSFRSPYRKVKRRMRIKTKRVRPQRSQEGKSWGYYILPIHWDFYIHCLCFCWQRCLLLFLKAFHR